MILEVETGAGSRERLATFGKAPLLYRVLFRQSAQLSTLRELCHRNVKRLCDC
jgi:hypothetical protein